GTPGHAPDAGAASTKALQRVESRFDTRWGGNAGAPKFPRSTELEWLLDIDRDAARTMAMAPLTLASMAARGLQDHLGGGFFRYCVDASWTIPHFEKMLYDNAQLLPAYARLAATPNVDAPLRETATAAVGGIVDWLARDMSAPNGAFYSSLDADSEHEEGKFYRWTREQMRALLSETEFSLAELAFGLDRPPNFEGTAWHLLHVASLDDIAREVGRSVKDVRTGYTAIRRKLFDGRETRTRPARDDKILTAWNALAISGLARAARLLDDRRCGDMALRTLNALRESTWIDGALFETLQLGFDARDLEWAIALADALLDKFADHDAGGFWFSVPAHGTPLAR